MSTDSPVTPTNLLIQKIEITGFETVEILSEALTDVGIPGFFTLDGKKWEISSIFLRRIASIDTI